MEYWKTCIDHNKDYMVSNMGNVISFKVCKEGRLLKPGKIWKKTNSNGYYIVVFINKGIKKTMFIHHLVIYYFYGPRPVGLKIDHINRIKHDNRICNLRYVTQSENNLNTKRSIKLDIKEKCLKKRAKIRKKKNRLKNQKYCICGSKYPHGLKQWIRHLQTKRHKNAIKNFFKF